MISESDATGIFQSDYLLALIKEDYSDKRKISLSTRNAIVNTLDSVVKPFDASIDYAFFMTSESENQYLFLLLATHECDDWEIDESDRNVCKNVSRKYFYCEPSDNKVLENHIFPKTFKVDSSFGKITLSDSDKSDAMGKPFIMGFSGWVVVDIAELRTDYLTALGNEFNCILVEKT